ncbi:hypothetical protein DICVIV_12655 [Dictyocaulus viviparus]|uniref:SCP domain-containing protein n=1 Tax=Dictyocaulus viviparus TaxID=29172 RepID=A0A0D8XC79_DICVI|nr:hypothetical protein DICVIV_12655 [Dictyocaulus viviparus]
MTRPLRDEVTLVHNSLRIYLAEGRQTNGRGEEAEKFPSVGDMKLLNYDCDFEKFAYNVAKLCIKDSSDYNFNYLGENNFTISSEVEFDLHTLSTKLEVGLMENAQSDKFGCAYKISNSENRKKFVSFTCSYRRPYDI